MRPPSGVDPQEPGTKEIVLSAELLDPLAERVHVGRERPAADNAVTPTVVSEADPPGDDQKGLNHLGRIAFKARG